jgi:UDP:flavonoid glycosyltransferase YjiC (YdhE family)
MNPLLPLARALGAAGHEVTLASGSEASATAAAAGFAFVEAGLDEGEMVARAAAELQDVAPGDRGIAMFAGIAAPALLRDLLPRLRRLAADLVIFDEGEWGGPVLAAIAGVPAVAHGWGAPLWTDDDLAAIAAAAAPLWTEHGLTPASPAGLFDGVYVDPCPPPLQYERAARVPRRRTVRFEPFDSGEEPPQWLEELRGRPLVYVTLGTVPTFNTAPDLIAAISDALADLDVDAVLTVGLNNDPRSLGPWPGNVRVAQHVSQVHVLRRSSAAVTHGGAGSTLAALAHGVPLLVTPRGAPSQRRLATRCAERCAALVLDADETTPGAIRAAVRALLEDANYRTQAENIRDSINAQPGAEALVPELETLAAG